MLSRAPFVGIVLFYISGILAADFLLPAFAVPSIVFSGIVFLLFCACFCLYRFKKKIAFGICFSVCLIFCGAFSKTYIEEDNVFKIQQIEGAAYSVYRATVRSLPEKRENSVRLEVAVNSIWFNGKFTDVNVKALVNIASETDNIPRPGDVILVKGNLQRPTAASNPDQFDYRAHLKNKGILWTDYLREDSFQIIPTQINSPGLTQWSLQLSEWADLKFRENLVNDQSYGLVKAMLLGRRDDLRSAQVDNYIASGTVHILSVSGMHVAIIFLVISTLLSWMKRWKYGNAIYLCTIIALLGFYALVTGMPPSVQRATIMCIVFVFAEVFARKNNAMNTLAVSALLILLFDPAALYDVGFQLSYLAMAGIFLLYPPILSVYNPGNNRILKFIWQVSVLSFAAQLATFPVSLYYFHQFPSYFWLVNPFVIAFTNVLLPSAILLLIVSVFNLAWLQWLLNFVTDLSAKLTDWSVTIPKLLPGYVVENLHVGMLEILILNAIMLLVWFAYHSREYIYLKCAFLLVFIFVSIGISQSVQTFLNKETVKFSVPKHAVIGVKQDNQLYLACDKSFVTDTTAYDFFIKNYAVSQEIAETVFVTKKN
ncbi:ComEC/Rec2 family competence protein [Dyadobacter sp. CY323]|uniref:ComEC/Rec2 family competence protein n=1 Tax=Dyadobacter sp. CY323 TaxID=2907302 RepID=UPI001F482D77|nr:ComEC/Rec2 family competence protein [Dyadobacter sp. CY323]MCE6992193.1 ComEC family competence protein [Dyadobacter sp. CY323]